MKELLKYVPAAIGGGAGFLLGGPAGAAAGAGLGLQIMGQQEANETNARIAKDATQTNVATSREQMAFQERMSSTAHQRQVADLKAAGLNPILSVNSGASSPSGAAGNAVAATMSNALEGLGASARELAFIKQNYQKGAAEIGLLGAQLRNAEAQADNARAASAKARMETRVMSKGIPEAELKNDIFDVVRPYVQKLKSSMMPSAKEVERENRMKDFKNRYQTPIQLRSR